MVRDIDRISVMKLSLVFAVFLWITNNTFISADADADIYQSIQDDLKNLNATCPTKDNCMEDRWGGDDLHQYSCHCSQFCTRLNSCCSDSPYNFVKPPRVVQACTKTSDTDAYFMIDRCPKSDSAWKRLCHEQWNDEDDTLKLVPVTSLFTHITYKNYYCFRCHEEGEDFLYWNVELSNDSEFDIGDENKVPLNYNQTSRSWTTLDKDGVLVPVKLSIECPWQLYQLTIACKPDVISRCSDKWTDKDVSAKCGAYMGIVSISHYNKDYREYIKYKNAHCALCNFEDLVNLYCDESKIEIDLRKRPFSFTHLIDVNPSDGDEVGKGRKCGKDFLWDPWAKKCRELACALPGYVVKDGKCMPS